MSPDRDRSALWITLYEVVTDHLADRRTAVVEHLGISFIKSKALRRLMNRPLTMGELTAELGTDPPYTTLLITDLVERALVERATDPSDRRRKLVALTAQGRGLATTAERILGEPPAGFDHLHDADVRQLVELFTVLSRRSVSS